MDWESTETSKEAIVERALEFYGNRVSAESRVRVYDFYFRYKDVLERFDESARVDYLREFLWNRYVVPQTLLAFTPTAI